MAKYPVGPDMNEYNYSFNEPVIHIPTGIRMWLVGFTENLNIVDCRLPDLTCQNFWRREIMPEDMFKEKYPDKEIKEYTGKYETVNP